jgi:hypothetical protein
MMSEEKVSHYEQTLMKNNQTENNYVDQGCQSIRKYGQYILHKNMCNMSRNINLLQC